MRKLIFQRRQPDGHEADVVDSWNTPQQFSPGGQYDFPQPDYFQPPTAPPVAQVQRYLYDLVADNEPRFRMFLKASMEQWLQTRRPTREPRRGARRLAMLEKALEPVRDKLDKPARERLIYALAALMSVESFIAMTDVCQLDRKKGGEVIAWAVRLLTEAALKESTRSSTAKKTLRR